MAAEVQNNIERSRYELLVDGDLVGVADYQLTAGAVVIPRTEIDVAKRGHGLGAQLVRGALDDIRRTGGSVVAQCPFVARFIDDHPEYADLRAA